MKRLWVRPEGRRSGAAHQLMQAVESRAREASISRLLLDTAPACMPAAVRLYQQLGYVPCPPYAGPPQPGIAYLQKRL